MGGITMSRAIILTIRDFLWDQHDDVKKRFRFFANPGETLNDTNKSSETAASENGGGRNHRSYSTGRLIGLILGPLLFVLILLFFHPEGLSDSGRAVLATTFWMAAWWITEAIPIPATSLLPIVLFPLTGALDIDKTTSSYADHTIFLFMGGFMIAMAMQKWDLHKRIALNIISVIGTNTDRIVLGFMVATGFLSMWISNSATAMMMVPIGLAIVLQVTDALKNRSDIDTTPENFNFGKALMLGIAYSASLGGIATLIGTPPNTLLIGAIGKLYDTSISLETSINRLPPDCLHPPDTPNGSPARALFQVRSDEKSPRK
jgi:sodium-dependent dicarboxylate transporter 2/3/5